MNKLCALPLLTCALLSAAPAVARAQQRFTVFNPTGSMRLQVSSPLEDIDVTMPIVAGRIEIMEGPTLPVVGKNLTLTRISLQFADLIMQTRSLGEKPVPFRNIGPQMTEGLVTWATEDQPLVFTIDIPNDATHITGDPIFRLVTRVDPAYFPGDKKVKEFYASEERTSTSIAGTMNYNTGIFEAKAIFQQPGGSFLGIPVGTRTITVIVRGPFRNPPPFP